MIRSCSWAALGARRQIFLFVGVPSKRFIVRQIDETKGQGVTLSHHGVTRLEEARAAGELTPAVLATPEFTLEKVDVRLLLV